MLKKPTAAHRDIRYRENNNVCDENVSKTQCKIHCTQCSKPYDCSRHMTGLLAYHLSVCLSQLAINV